MISIDSFYSIAEVEPRVVTDALIIGELGAGWGRIGYILKKINPKLTYAIFDLPEVLLVSSVHLPRRLPTENVLTYSEGRELKQIGRNQLNSKGLAFFGAHHLKLCEEGLFDIFINIASFQEMSKAQVSSYFDIIDYVLKGTLFTQQLWNSNTHGYDVGEISMYEDYPFKENWSQEYLRNTAWSDLYFETALRRNAKIISN